MHDVPLLIVPALHDAHIELPWLAAIVPGPHATHVFLFGPGINPALHWEEHAPLPATTDINPAGHAEHFTAPPVAEYVPEGHNKQDVFVVVSGTLPTGHDCGIEIPKGQMYPLGHIPHSNNDAPPVVIEKLPGGQYEHSTFEPSLYMLIGQGKHADDDNDDDDDDDDVFAPVPAGHWDDEQLDAPAALNVVEFGHGEQDEEAIVFVNVPAGHGRHGPVLLVAGLYIPYPQNSHCPVDARTPWPAGHDVTVDIFLSLMYCFFVFFFVLRPPSLLLGSL
jgi:hypothetical protein